MPDLKITLYPAAVKKSLLASVESDDDKKTVEEHADAYTGFVKKELHREGFAVALDPAGEGNEGEYDDSELPDQDARMKAATAFTAIPGFWEWHDAPEREAAAPPAS